MWRQKPSAPAWPDPAWCPGIIWAGAGRNFISWHPFGWARRSSWELRAVVQGEGSALRAGRCCCLIPTLLNPRRGALRGRALHRFAFPFFPLAPGPGGGWKGELQPRARRDVCPQGRYPRDCCNPGSLFPAGVGCAAGPTGCSSFSLSFPAPTLSPFPQ